jgi:hypothetical protein
VDQTLGRTLVGAEPRPDLVGLFFNFGSFVGGLPEAWP